MTYLLDTHTLIWALTDFENLPVKVQQIIGNKSNEIIVSALASKSSGNRLIIANFYEFQTQPLRF